MAIIRTVLVVFIAALATMSVTLFATTPTEAPTVSEPTATDSTSSPQASTTNGIVNEVATTAEPLAQVPEVSADTVKVEGEPAAPAPVAEPQQAGPSDAELNAAARAALVNIFCTTKSGGIFKPLSGTGVLIDSRGVILTNAHIGQYYLLQDYPAKGNLDCNIRMGSPAVAKYKAELLYISSDWIVANASQIGSKTAKGTGENDFALLYITDGGGATHSALPYKQTAPKVGERMLLAAYPAGFLSGESIATYLYPTSAFAYVLKAFTFDDPKNTDLISIGGSVVSQAGASGGAVARADGNLAGLISTAVLDGTTGERDLRAITVGHIDRSLAAAGHGSLTQLLSGNLATKQLNFAQDVAPALTELLEEALED